MQDFSVGALRPTSLDDRRRRPRRPHHDEHRVTVVDGLLAGQQFDCTSREIVPGESASLLVRADLRVGQRVKVQSMHDGHPTGMPQNAEVMRSRLLTTGRYEVVIEYRKAAVAPKPSESQRRHERRQQRLARVQALTPVKRDVNDLLPMRELPVREADPVG